jgi:hypothetical protein
MDNSGRGPLRVPGFSGIPIEYVLQCEDRFAHSTEDLKQVPAVTAREWAMVAAMNSLTDKPDWQVKIFDDNIVASWREEALAASPLIWSEEFQGKTPLLSEKAWTWCLAELRDKAVFFNKNHYVRTLDTGSCICKSDILVPESVGAKLKAGVIPLFKQPNKDWQPESDDQVLNLVDPLLFPLVYGRSLVLEDGGQVDLDNTLASGSFQHAKLSLKHFDSRVDSLNVQMQIDQGFGDTFEIDYERDRWPESRRVYHWSYNFQQLPCEVAFTKNSGTDVHVTSYINNLHPTHNLLYESVERLISLAIKPWNDCLIQGKQGWQDFSNQGQRGPIPLRIITYGVEWVNEIPEWALDLMPARDWRHEIQQRLEIKKLLQDTSDTETGKFAEKWLEAQNLLEKTSWLEPLESRLDLKPTPELLRWAKEYLEMPDKGSSLPKEVARDWENNLWYHILATRRRIMYWKHPEPGTVFSYEDWRTGNNNKAVIEMVTEGTTYAAQHTDFHPVRPDHEPYKIALEDTFRIQGLQVIVKIDSVELTPDKPVYPGSSWQLEAQLNEHIVATAIYLFDVENIRETRISFRQETSVSHEIYRFREEELFNGRINPRLAPGHGFIEVQALSEILGIESLWDPEYVDPDEPNELPVQKLGSVAMPRGRLLTFPNTMERRIEPFQLVDHSLPGHCRSVVLYLVDPHYRVCSTRNVPPQQHDWWAQGKSDDLFSNGVPRDSAAKTGHEWTMGINEARKVRLDLIKERRWTDMARYTGMERYGFY